jgi:transposase
MRKSGEAFVGIDAAKARNAVNVAEGGRQGELGYVGEFDTAPDAVAKLVRKLADRHETLHFCYEAGPTGYGQYRQMLNAMQASAEQIERPDAMLLEIIPDWPVVAVFQAMRGFEFTNAATLAAEAGDIRRFDHPRQLMAFLGLVPSEGGRTVVHDHAARQAGEDRREDRSPQPIHNLPDG